MYRALFGRGMLSLLVGGIIVLLCWLPGSLPLQAQQLAEPKQKLPERDYAHDPYWQHAKAEVYKSVLELMAQHKNELLQGIKYHKFYHGDSEKKQIALTFDDGPHAKYTPKLLKILAQEQVKATFFVVGEMADRHPNFIRDEFAAGHAIGNHTYHHVNLTKILDSDVPVEIKACGEAIKRITGEAPHLFRPPGGDYDTGVITASEALGYTTILWTDDPGDYARPSEEVILRRTLEQASNGGIILLHDGVQQTVDILPRLISTLKKQGYEFVTIDQMLAQPPFPAIEGPLKEL